MKHLKKVAFLCTLSLLFISCSSDNSTLQIDGSQIVGTWNLTNIIVDGKTTSNVGGNEVVTTSTATGIEFNNVQLTFAENPNQINTTGSYTVETVTELNGVEVSRRQEVLTADDDFGQAIWSVNGNILTVSDGTNPTEYEILEFTATSLKLRNVTDTEVEVQGNVSTINVTSNLTLSK